MYNAKMCYVHYSQSRTKKKIPKKIYKKKLFPVCACPCNVNIISSAITKHGSPKYTVNKAAFLHLDCMLHARL
jgi:hypothetical protein